jgi:hypothetical protein
MRDGSGEKKPLNAKRFLTRNQGAKANRAAYDELGLRIVALLAGISNVVQKAPGNRFPSIHANLEDVIQQVNWISRVCVS